MAKRIRVSRVNVPPEHDMEHVIKKACRISGIRPESVRRHETVKQSIDARKKGDIKYSYTVDLIVEGSVRYREGDSRVREVKPVRYAPGVTGTEVPGAPIAVIGSGPAGLFCALMLAEHGYRPMIFERGKRVDERMADVELFWSGGKPDPESNVQFGEGGAGTFSDGKLNTSVRDDLGRDRFILETFVRFGAPGDILYVSRPHIGTDILRVVISNMREEIIRLGGRFLFSTGIRDMEILSDVGNRQRVDALVTAGSERVKVAAAVFAVGHSARDTFAMLREHGVRMEPKPFAVGMRIEHPQEQIDLNQYGEEAGILPHADYRLTYRAENGRSVYSFCMCPGGYVINASSEEGRCVVNGMSDRARDSGNANSAIVVSVTPGDFDDPSDPLSGIAFQRELEERAFAAGNGKIPQQRFGDYEGDPKRDGAGLDPDKEGQGACEEPDEMSSRTKGESVFADLKEILPDELREALVAGVHAFAGHIEGFDRPDAVLSAVESRTSSPVRILRDEFYESSIAGLYPCGEGAGYAGGIMSAAMDGLRVAEALMARYAPARDGDKDAGAIPG